MNVSMLLAALIFAGTVLIASVATGDPRPPDLGDIGGATVSGLFDTPVTLKEGRWEGEPYVPGGASRPTAGVAGEQVLVGDLTGDGALEAVAFLWSATGGSGTRNFLAVFAWDGDRVISTATAPIGDRVQVRSARIRDRRIEVDVLQHGPDDPRCCPTIDATRVWVIEDGRLLEKAATADDPDHTLRSTPEPD